MCLDRIRSKRTLSPQIALVGSRPSALRIHLLQISSSSWLWNLFKESTRAGGSSFDAKVYVAEGFEKPNILPGTSLVYQLSLSHALQEPRILPREHLNRIFLWAKCASRWSIELFKLFKWTLRDDLDRLHFLFTHCSCIVELFLLLESQLVLPIDYLAADAEGNQVVPPLSGWLDIIAGKVLDGILLHDLDAETKFLKAPLALLIVLSRFIEFAPAQHPCGMQRADLPQGLHLSLKLSLLFWDYEWRVKFCLRLICVVKEPQLRWAV